MLSRTSRLLVGPSPLGVGPGGAARLVGRRVTANLSSFRCGGSVMISSSSSGNAHLRLIIARRGVASTPKHREARKSNSVQSQRIEAEYQQGVYRRDSGNGIGDMKKLVSKKNPLCIAVIDATDYEGAVMPRTLMQHIMGQEAKVVLALTKVDRFPLSRYEASQVRSHEERFTPRLPEGASFLGSYAVSSRSGAGLARLAHFVKSEHDGDVLLVGMEGVGKSELARALGKIIEADALADGTLLDGANLTSLSTQFKMSQLVAAEDGAAVPQEVEVEAAAAGGGATAAAEVGMTIAQTEEKNLQAVATFGGVGGNHGGNLRTIWDSPGVPNRVTMGACVPSPLAAPFLGEAAHGGRIRHPPRLFVRPGESIVVRAPNALDRQGERAVVARIDVTKRKGKDKDKEVAADDDEPLFSQDTAGGKHKSSPSSSSSSLSRKGSLLRAAAFLPQFLSVDVMDTEEAPTRLAATPSADAAAAAVESDLATELLSTVDLPLIQRTGSKIKRGKNADTYAGLTHAREWKFAGGYAVDVGVAGLGHVGLYGNEEFSVAAHTPDGVQVLVRKPLFGRVALFPHHLRGEEISEMLQSGQLLQGVIQQKRRSTAMVFGNGGEYSTIAIKGANALNRALHGDTVALRILPREEWGRSLVDMEQGGLDDIVAAEEELEEVVPAEEEVAVADSGWGDGPSAKVKWPTAEVVGILARSEQPFVAVVDPVTADKKTQVMVGRRLIMPKLALEGAAKGERAKKGYLYAAKVSRWLADKAFPSGVVERTIGKVGDTVAEGEAILLDHAIEKPEFTEAAVTSLPGSEWRPEEEQMHRRIDLREGAVGEAICSVDPPNAADIDDALHAVEIGRGEDGKRRFEIGCHIADVCHFIPPGEALDGEAASRGTTFYLVDQRVNMLPDVLGENVGSLHPGVERYAFSVLWQIDEEANVLSSKVAKTLIRSRAALSYADAQERIDALPVRENADSAEVTAAIEDPLTRSLSILYEISHAIRKKRVAGGALRLASPQVKFDLGDFKRGNYSEDPSRQKELGSMKPHDMTVDLPLGTNDMVEEFMLLANITVAKTIKEAFPQTALLRRHPHPQPEHFVGLHEKLSQHGLGLDLSTSTSLAESLDACEKAGEPYFNLLSRFMAVRCMPAAEYVTAGEVEQAGESLAHFGLATPIYSHFTSPIRRYGDQIVHRMLAASIGWEEPHPQLSEPGAMSAVARRLNERRVAAKAAERASVNLYSLVYFKERDVVEMGYVTAVNGVGVNVLVPRFGIEGFHHFGRPGTPAFDKSPFKMADDRSALIVEGAEDGEALFKILPFDRVCVRISVDEGRVSPSLEMELLDEATRRPLADVLSEKVQEAASKSAASSSAKPKEEEPAPKSLWARLFGG